MTHPASPDANGFIPGGKSASATDLPRAEIVGWCEEQSVKGACGRPPGGARNDGSRGARAAGPQVRGRPSRLTTVDGSQRCAEENSGRAGKPCRKKAPSPLPSPRSRRAKGGAWRAAYVQSPVRRGSFASLRMTKRGCDAVRGGVLRFARMTQGFRVPADEGSPVSS